MGTGPNPPGFTLTFDETNCTVKPDYKDETVTIKAGNGKVVTIDQNTGEIVPWVDPVTNG